MFLRKEKDGCISSHLLETVLNLISGLGCQTGQEQAFH